MVYGNLKSLDIAKVFLLFFQVIIQLWLQLLHLTRVASRVIEANVPAVVRVDVDWAVINMW